MTNFYLGLAEHCIRDYNEKDYFLQEEEINSVSSIEKLIRLQMNRFKSFGFNIMQLSDIYGALGFLFNIKKDDVLIKLARTSRLALFVRYCQYKNKKFKPVYRPRKVLKKPEGFQLVKIESGGDPV